jgi:hypothetical protein
MKIAVPYKEAVDERMAWGKIESEKKQELLALVKDAKLKPLSDGKIRFKVDGMTITVTPTELKIAVKMDDPDGE